MWARPFFLFAVVITYDMALRFKPARRPLYFRPSTPDREELQAWEGQEKGRETEKAPP